MSSTLASAASSTGQFYSPNILHRKFSELLLPILESFVVLAQDLLVLLELVPHLNLCSAGLVEFGCLLIKVGL